MNSLSLSFPLLTVLAYQCLSFSFCLFKTWRKKEIAATTAATKLWILKEAKKSKTLFIDTKAVGLMRKMKFIITWLLNNCAPGIPLRN